MTARTAALASIAAVSLAWLPAGCATAADAAAPAAASASLTTAPVAAVAEKPITEADVLAAQNAWGDALVRIATTYDTQGAEAARRVAEAVIDGAYGYNLGPVLFKPTLAAPPTTFRTTRKGALAYFVGGDADYPSDTGFALRGWRSYAIENAAIFIDGDVAMSTGNVRLTDSKGAVTVVDKTWGYKRDDAGALRIVAHHSSLPYSAN
jgi:hypothetical protein